MKIENQPRENVGFKDKDASSEITLDHCKKYYCVACLMISIQAGFYQRAEAGHQEGEELNLSRHRCHRAK